MIAFSWRMWVRAIHRDCGYVFFGATIIYAASGVAINHRKDWNPNYSIARQELIIEPPGIEKRFTNTEAREVLAQIGIKAPYQSHYAPAEGQTKIFFEGGSALLDRASGRVVLETLHKRPLLNTFNRLHRNPGIWWTWFADIFCAALLIIAITGLFLLRGHHGITRRGGVLVLIGIAIPTLLILYYL